MSQEAVGQRLALARHWLEVGRPDRCLQELDRGDVGGDVVDAFELRAEALLKLDRDREAALQARRGLALEADHPQLLALLGMACAAIGELAEAERAFLAALRQEPEDAWLLGQYAMLLTTAGRLEKAQRVADEGARLDPEQPAVRYAHSLIAHVQGKDRRAAEILGNRLGEDPEDVAGHVLMGAFTGQTGRVSLSAKHWRTAASLAPQQDIADAARQARVLGSPALAPIRVFHRFGPAKVWLIAMAIGSSLLAARREVAAIVFLGLYLTLVLYSWVATPLARHWYRWRR